LRAPEFIGRLNSFGGGAPGSAKGIRQNLEH
jgi:hypothetical protein